MINPAPKDHIRYPVMLQGWRNVAFLHWRCRPEQLQQLLPAGLEVETYEGTAWVSMVLFQVHNMRLPFLPALPWLSDFPQVNVRTYVRGPDARTGLWLFSLDAARLPAVLGAKAGYGLPYHWARMQIMQDAGTTYYKSIRRDGKQTAYVAVAPQDPLRAPSEQDHFLTARYRLYSQHLGRLCAMMVEHRPWPLRSAQVLAIEENLLAAAGIRALGTPALAHFSVGVDARVGRPKFLTASQSAP